MSLTHYSWNDKAVMTVIAIALVTVVAILFVYFMSPESITSGDIPGAGAVQ